MESPVNIVPAKKTLELLELKSIKKIALGMAIILLFLFLLAIFAFTWRRSLFQFDLPIDSSLWGFFGEFVSGLIGTIVTVFSVLLLIRTLKFQIYSYNEIAKNNRENTEIYILQQFHDTFNTLVTLYQKSIETIKSDDGIIGKAFFHNQVIKMGVDFNSDIENYAEVVQNTLVVFNRFYSSNRALISVYFKLIFRLLQHIDMAEISENKKADYAKILRCQLSDSEMILLRYNAMSSHGKKMQVYLNRYNLLKHIPIMSLIEFSEWSTRLNTEQRNSLDAFIIDLRKKLISMWITDNENNIEIHTADNKYKTHVLVEKANSKVKIEILRNRKITESNDMLSITLDIFADPSLEKFLEFVVYEIFVYSNFSIFARIDDILIEKDIHTEKHSKLDVIWVRISSRSKYPLIFSQRQLDYPRI